MLEAFVDSTEPRRVLGNGWQCPGEAPISLRSERLEQDSGTMEALPITFTTSTVLLDVIKLRKRVDILPVRVRSTGTRLHYARPHRVRGDDSVNHRVRAFSLVQFGLDGYRDYAARARYDTYMLPVRCRYEQFPEDKERERGLAWQFSFRRELHLCKHRTRVA